MWLLIHVGIDQSSMDAVHALLRFVIVSYEPILVSSFRITSLVLVQLILDSFTVPLHSTNHDDVIKWKHFPRYCRTFEWVIHRSPVNSPQKGQWRGALMFTLICAWTKWLGKQSWGWWFETPSRSLWRHCNAAGICHPLGLCIGLSVGSEKLWEFSLVTWAHNAKAPGNHQSMFIDQPITKGWCRPIGSSDYINLL